MKWTVLNAFGGLAWLSGLFYAKGATLPAGNPLAGDDHNFIIGMIFCTAGLALLLWGNLRSAA